MSEVGFRDMSKNNEVKVESTKPATDLKMTPATTLVPDKNYLPPRPSRPGDNNNNNYWLLILVIDWFYCVMRKVWRYQRGNQNL